MVNGSVRGAAAAARPSSSAKSGIPRVDEGDMRRDLIGHHRVPPGSQFLHRPAAVAVKERGGMVPG
jgi:hypothetical protein